MSERIKIPFTNEHFAAWCLSMLGQPYWYGTVVYKCSESLRAQKSRQYPAHYGSERTARYAEDIAAGCVCADCVGGAKGYAWTDGGDGVVESIGTDKTFSSRYGANNCPDKSANGMFAYARSEGAEWGSIDTLPDVVGLALHRDGHVGYSVGGGYAVEWRGFRYGCVRTRISGRGWTHWYRLPFIDYGDGNDASVPGAAVLGSRLLRKGMNGADVKALQEMLMRLGYELPGYGADAEFGAETERAVSAFQRDEGLTQDGKYGSETHEALMDAVAEAEAGGKGDDPETGADESSGPEEEKRTVVIDAGKGGMVNVRVGHGTAYKRITTVPTGTAFEYVATAANGWNAVVVAGQVGWVSGRYSGVI